MYAFEIQHPWTPACGWLRSPYPRATWEQAFAEGKTHVENAARRGVVCGLRIVEV
jgi:hypothetical protein